jgi:diacylglycerol diphosphate phosphatase/phosphatidate phosphatase
MIVIPTLVILTISGFLKPHVFDAHNALLGMFAAAAMSGLATDLLKSGVGRLRPDFLARCMVNPKYYNGTIPPGPGGFVDESVCTTTDVQSLLNGRQSFPSGHTSGRLFARECYCGNIDD